MDNKQYTLCQSIRWAIKQPPGWVSIPSNSECTRPCNDLSSILTYWRLLVDETFPVTTDARHFTPMPTPFTAIARDVKLEYDTQQWDSIAAWNPHCIASVAYPLFKLKDILAT